MANTPPVVAVGNHTVVVNRWVQLSNWLTYSDANGDPAVQYAFYDEGAGTSSAYLWTPDNPHHGANAVFIVNASDLGNVWIRAGAIAGTEKLDVEASDGTNWSSSWTQFTLTTVVNSAPVATISDYTLVKDRWDQPWSRLIYTDANGDPAVQYQFQDTSSGANSAYFLTPDNSHQPANTPFTVDAADIRNVWIRSGASTGTDTMMVRASDGTDWGNWDSFTISTVANTAPTVTGSTVNLPQNHWVSLLPVLTYSDGNGDPAVQYQFQDNGIGGAYFWTPDNVVHPAGTPFTVNASDVGNVWIRGGASPGSETMQVRAFDGTDWSLWNSFTVNTAMDSAPVATINDQNLVENRWAQVSSWLHYSDTEGDPAVQYDFSDGGTAANSAYFYTPDNPQHPANADFIVNAADLASVWLRGGAVPGTDTMWVRAFDGTNWGGWDSFNITTVVNSAPTISASTQTVKQNHWSQLAFMYSDVNGDPAVQYQFQDNGTAAGSAYLWTPDTPQVPAGTPFTVNAADISKVWIKGGLSFASETMQIRAFDGYDWGAWYSFTVNTQPQSPPTVTIDDAPLPQGAWVPISGWLHYSDADGDPAVAFRFYDGSAGASSDYFWTADNGQQPANTTFNVNASDINKVWFRAGTDVDTETMQVAGFDGTTWSSPDAFSIRTTQQTLPVATVNDHSLSLNQWAQLSNWIVYSDAPQNNAAVQYQFTDGISAANSAYFWTPDNSHQPANAPFTVNASDLGNVWIRGGSATGMDLMTVRVFDGLNWSNPDQFTLTTTM